MTIEADATFFDGLTNRKRAVRVRIGSSLDIVEEDRPVATWPLDAIRLVDLKPAMMRLRVTQGQELARLTVADEDMIAAVSAACPNLLVEDHTRKASMARIVFWSMAAAASLLAVIFFGVPLAADRIAPLVPSAFDRRIGEMVDAQVKTIFGDKLCTRPDGRAAFNKMVQALQRAGKLDAAPAAEVLESRTPNAIALPGGRVYLFAGLLEEAQSPDEIAGVLAHELGHVAHRDGMRMLIESGGSSFMFGLLFGDVTGSTAAIFAARTMLNARYTRGAEAQADDFAIATMHALGRPSRPMGEMLFRITGNQRGRGPGLLASHPYSEDRLAKMKAADGNQSGPPILDEAEWQALKNICKPEG
jgi:Zn-dependent protease with chaperone function